jgi:hypothetical protein
MIRTGAVTRNKDGTASVKIVPTLRPSVLRYIEKVNPAKKGS